MNDTELASEWAKVSTLEGLQRFIVKTGFPKLLLVNEEDFWRFLNSVPPNQRYVTRGAGDTAAFTVMSTEVRLNLPPSPRPKVVDVSDTGLVRSKSS